MKIAIIFTLLLLAAAIAMALYLLGVGRNKPREQPGKSSPLSPKNRPGRPRGAAPKDPNEQRSKSPRAPKLDFVCWKRDRAWILAVELPNDVCERPSVTVVQNEIPLVKDESERGRWRLAQLHGEVIVRAWEAGKESWLKLALGDHDCLVFKLSGRDLNQGRRVNQVSLGSYLVIAPATWQRDEEKAGPAPASPESVSLEGYRAHFFDLVGSASSRVALRDPTGRALLIGSPGTRFQLVGEELHDASENLGPLFGGSPPRIGVTHERWESVGTIVLGVEGSVALPRFGGRVIV